MYNNPMFMMNPTNTLTRTIAPNLMRNSGAAMNVLGNSQTSGGLFSRLATSLTGIKKINWSGLINNTSKTLGIINQSIPIVKQVGPMVGNMRSMMKVATIFKNETTPIKTQTKIINNNQTNNTISNNYQSKENTQKEKTIFSSDREYSESPIFFIN